MVTFYLDTSAFVKRYKTEEGTEFIDKLFESLETPDRAATSFFGVLEFISTCRRLLKAGEIDSEEFNNMVANFLSDAEKYYIFHSVDDDIVSKGIEKIIDHAIKSADSLHLATATEMRRLLGETEENFIFIADDEEHCESAKAEGLDTVNPREEKAWEKLQGFTKGEEGKNKR